MKITKANLNPIRYCVQDNDNGPVAYCYTEEAAIDIINGLNTKHNIDPSQECEELGFNRFAYEDMRQYTLDGNLPPLLLAQLALAFFDYE